MSIYSEYVKFKRRKYKIERQIFEPEYDGFTYVSRFPWFANKNQIEDKDIRNKHNRLIKKAYINVIIIVMIVIGSEVFHSFSYYKKRKICINGRVVSIKNNSIIDVTTIKLDHNMDIRYSNENEISNIHVGDSIVRYAGENSYFYIYRNKGMGYFMIDSIYLKWYW